MNLTQQRAIRDVTFGRAVDFTGTTTLPATATQNLFVVNGGRIILTGIVGEVTTVIQTQACNAKLISTPTTGTAVDLCGVLNISAKEVGCLFGITGTLATALVGANAGATNLLATPIIIPIGVIGLNTSATNTGAIKWRMTYVALDSAASVVSA